MSVNGMGVAATAGGVLLVWSGLKGASVTSSLKDLISGQQPAGTVTNPVGLASFGVGSLGPVPGAPAPPPAPGHGSYTTGQLKSLWILAGGPPSAAAAAACIAMHESSGEPAVTSANPDGGVNVGLWQLDTRGKGAGHTVAQLQNPLTNARLTVAATGGGRDWSAWATASMCGV